MDFLDVLKRLATKVDATRNLLETEEATKNAIIMPVINALGYSVFDPTEVTPEFTADVGTKKGEKVDYAINIDGTPMILIECKSIGTKLTFKHASQLYRYFGTTDARFAVLTNGLLFWFYTDLETPNRMDETPFFEFNLADFDKADVDELKKFSKSSFDLSNILSNASELKYVKEIQRHLTSEIEEPTEEFVRMLVNRVYSGRITASVIEQFTPLIRNAFRQLLQDSINERLKTALQGGDIQIAEPSIDEETEEVPDDGIITTDEEIEGFHIVRAILASKIDSSRVVMRDTKSYCGVLLDDNNRQPICRLHFNASTLYLGVFDEQRKETRHAIEKPSDIYSYGKSIESIVDRYDNNDSPSADPEASA